MLVLAAVAVCSFYLGAFLVTYLVSYKSLISSRLLNGPASLREFREIRNDSLVASLIWPKSIYWLYTNPHTRE